MRSSLLSLASLASLLSFAVVACSSSSAPASSVDAAIADAAPFDAPSGPNTSGITTCSTMAATGSAVTITVVDAQAAPVAAGGTIVDGTYQLTALTQYGGAVPFATSDAGTAVPYTSTIVLAIASTSWQLAGDDPSDGAYTTNYQVVPVTGATNVELDETCPDGETSETISYTATPTSLTWYVGNNGVTTASTFTKE